MIARELDAQTPYGLSPGSGEIRFSMAADAIRYRRQRSGSEAASRSSARHERHACGASITRSISPSRRAAAGGADRGRDLAVRAAGPPACRASRSRASCLGRAAGRRRTGCGPAAGDRPAPRSASPPISRCSTRDRDRSPAGGVPPSRRRIERRRASCRARGAWRASAAGRALDRCARARERGRSPAIGLILLSRRHRARVAALRLSGRARPDASGSSGCRPASRRSAPAIFPRASKVEGNDEVARLAASFNRAAARIEELVDAHRLLLAQCLARIAHAAVAHPARHRAASAEAGSEIQGRAEPRHRRARLADRRNPAGEPARHDQGAVADARECRPAGAGRGKKARARYDDCVRRGRAGDRHRRSGDLLARLVRNLLDNAAQHGAPPLRVERRIADGGQALIDVIDAGAGIPAAERERVFVPFYRLPGERKGAGLGLSLVRQIARLHGGDVSVVARPDAASTMRVTLRRRGKSFGCGGRLIAVPDTAAASLRSRQLLPLRGMAGAGKPSSAASISAIRLSRSADHSRENGPRCR